MISLAPEFEDIQGWLNTPNPLALRELRGKVVFLDFWTYGCINCINTRPHFRRMYEHFKDNDNFVMIGVHTPEFAFERDPDNVRKAVLGYDLKYPIALDTYNTTWKLYGNHYWPRQVIIDGSGQIRYTHIGEGGYQEMTKKVSELLLETREKSVSVASEV